MDEKAYQKNFQTLNCGSWVNPSSPVNAGLVLLFKVVDTTTIVKNGQPVPLRALQPRDLAEVRFFVFREGRIAAAIVAKSPVPPTTTR